MTAVVMTTGTMDLTAMRAEIPGLIVCQNNHFNAMGNYIESLKLCGDAAVNSRQVFTIGQIWCIV